MDLLDDSRVGRMRQFNRFYTRQIGLLRQGLLGTPYSLGEARVLYEIARGETKAAVLAGRLNLDPAFLSRLLGRLTARGLVGRTLSAEDRRRAVLALTEKGQAEFATLDRKSQQDAAAQLAALSDADQRRLIEAMGVIERLLGSRASEPERLLGSRASEPERLLGSRASEPERLLGSRATEPAVTLRPFGTADLGIVLARHGAIYGEEYGWGRPFEALVAQIIVEFLRRHDPEREACWIAEWDGEPVGSVALMDAGDGVGKLRLLLVEPRVRGLGVGRRLVEECIRFGRRAGYRKIVLWTQSVLTPARTLYVRSGFTRTAQEPHCLFGVDLVGETWELEL